MRCNQEALKKTLTWTNTYIIFVAQVDAADLHLQVLDHLGGQFLHKRVLLLLCWFLCRSRTWREYLSLIIIQILPLQLRPGPGPET